ncbi:MAG: filamentous hemagglutinin N-terminal domain-containing protein [Desulfobacteraceae bacterium]|nr:filamentous hemagglutinin N-terminal domain-containing protein [Desulfobacteraceae bacterium]
MKKILPIFIISIFLILSIQSQICAQVILDGSMGMRANLNGPDYDIQASFGRQSGANLFHSFQTFNINTNESANFSGPASVQNIISRVTGGSASQIDGTLRSTIPDANLYLLNPAGVMFGANASLDIGGSFHVSTADYLKMEGNERFHTLPRQGEMLSAAPPSAFGFMDKGAPITFDGKEIPESDWDGNSTGLAVSEGKTISVIGGDIEIAGSFYEDTLREKNILLGSLDAPGGRVNIAGIGSEGEVVPTESGLDISSAESGSIMLDDHALISVSGQGSGSIYIRPGNFLLTTTAV